MGEPFSWGKFFSGLVDPTGYFKTLADVLRIVIFIVIAIALYFGAVKAYRFLFPPKPSVITFEVSSQTGGQVRNSADQKTNKFGLFTF